MNKFNGKYGCFMCIQQGENLISNERGNNFKYTFKPNEMFIRTEHKYAQNSKFKRVLEKTKFLKE
jgi:hypothetical protein